MAKINTLLVICTLLFSQLTQAANLKTAAWLQGCWVGKGLGGKIEECWVQDAKGKLTAVFQLTKNGQQQFSELISLGEYNGRIEMRVKHFDQNFNQWKSDNNRYFIFKLAKQSRHLLEFDGLTYQLTNPNTLKVTLAIKNKNNQTQSETFYLARRNF